MMAVDYEAGKLDHRLETAITGTMDAAIDKLARELAGGKSAKHFRSKAARKILIAGVKALKVDVTP